MQTVARDQLIKIGHRPIIYIYQDSLPFYLHVIAQYVGALYVVRLHKHPSLQAKGLSRKPLQFDSFDCFRVVDGTTIQRRIETQHTTDIAYASCHESWWGYESMSFWRWHNCRLSSLLNCLALVLTWGEGLMEASLWFFSFLARLSAVLMWGCASPVSFMKNM